MATDPAPSTSAHYLERFLSLHPKVIDLSLGRLQSLCAKLGHPERQLPPVIHVAGTNGKGSTVAFLRALLEADGKTVHAFTSPHLVRFHERIRLGSPQGSAFVDEDVLVEAFETCERVNDGAPITFFEITTAAAFLLFSQHPADVLLLEVGLGGRFDATNVIETPLASVITPISMDHMGFLGDSLAKIAGEKAGIIKQNCPVIASPQRPAAEAVLLAQAQRLNAPLYLAGQDWQGRPEHGRMVYEDTDQLLDLPLPNLIGQHQIINAAAAIATLSVVGLLPAAHRVAKGITSAFWPARLQRLEAAEFGLSSAKKLELYLDGAHNEGAAKVLSAALADMNETHPKPLTLICGMLSTKDAAAFFAEFKGLAARIYTVPIPDETAGVPAPELAACARDHGFVADAVEDVPTALKAISREEGGQRVMICGSLYLAGHVLKTIKAL